MKKHFNKIPNQSDELLKESLNDLKDEFLLNNSQQAKNEDQIPQLNDSQEEKNEDKIPPQLNDLLKGKSEDPDRLSKPYDQEIQTNKHSSRF